MGDLIDTGEMYLKTVYELEEEGIVPLRARIAERLGHSGPTVSETVSRLSRDGLLNIGQGRQLELTDEGRRLATTVMRKHRLAERLLADVIGVDWPELHDEACRWEHVMSEIVATKLSSVLTETDTDPYGNPIPHMAEGPGRDVASRAGLVPLADVLSDEPVEVEIVRLAEPIQVNRDLLADLHALGIGPGSTVRASALESVVQLDAPAGSLRVPEDVARHLFTRA